MVNNHIGKGTNRDPYNIWSHGAAMGLNPLWCSPKDSDCYQKQKIGKNIVGIKKGP